VLGLLPLRGIDFREANVYQEFGVDLNYTDQGTYGLEFRTFFHGVADLWLDRVILVSHPVAFQSSIILESSGGSVEGLRIKFIDGAGNLSVDSIPTPLNLPNKSYLPFVLKQR